MDSLLKKNQSEIIRYCREYNVKYLYAFGSIISGDFSDKSDIDLLIKFNELTIEKYTDNYFQLHYIFEKLFQRKIDLLTENSLSNPYFIKTINKTKTLIYEG